MKKMSALVMCLMLSLGCSACGTEDGGEYQEIKAESSFEVISGGSRTDNTSENDGNAAGLKDQTVSVSAGNAEYDDILSGNNVLEINITADASEWQQMLKDAASKPWIKCGIEINGEKLADVGVKPKGNTSLQQVLRDGSTRLSLKVSFGKYTDGQTFHGLDKLALNNIYSDTTYLKEYMSYKLMEYMGVPCSMCTFANIKVNGEHYGFFLAVEDVDDSFLDRVYGEGNEVEAYKPDAMDTQMAQAMNGQQFTPSGGMPQTSDGQPIPPGGMLPQSSDGQPIPPGGMLPQSSDGQPIPPGGMIPQSSDGQPIPPDGMIPQSSDGQISLPDKQRPDMAGGRDGGVRGVDLTYSDDSVESYSNIFDNAITKPSDDDKSRLIYSIKGLNEETDIEKYVNVDEVLRYLACNVFLVNLDSYLSSNCHNYILAENNGVLSMLPWDYNLSFGSMDTKSAEAAVNYAIDTVLNGIEAEKRPMVTKLLEKEEYREKYHSYLREIAANFIQSGLFDETVDKAVSVIDSYVKADTTSFYGYDAFKEGVTALRLFASLREESVIAQLDGTIPSYQSDRDESTVLTDASSLSMEKLGTMSKGDKGDKQKPLPSENVTS